jgi:hypothetical protein
MNNIQIFVALVALTFVNSVASAQLGKNNGILNPDLATESEHRHTR